MDPPKVYPQEVSPMDPLSHPLGGSLGGSLGDWEGFSMFWRFLLGSLGWWMDRRFARVWSLNRPPTITKSCYGSARSAPTLILLGVISSPLLVMMQGPQTPTRPPLLLPVPTKLRPSPPIATEHREIPLMNRPNRWSHRSGRGR